MADITSSHSIEAKRLSELKQISDGDQTELLKYRYLSREGTLLLTGSTGIGKSSLSIQAMILWALGRPAFGIVPAHLTCTPSLDRGN